MVVLCKLRTLMNQGKIRFGLDLCLSNWKKVWQIECCLID